MENQISITAIMTSYMRAFHAAHAKSPVFNDFLAYNFIPAENRKMIEEGFARALGFAWPDDGEFSLQQVTAVNAMMQFMGAANVLCRSQYAESVLEAAISEGVTQYVILGAGLDTFAFRRPELVEKLQVFEVDHPLTQAFKRQRITNLGWKTPENLHMVPVDFNRDSLTESLRSADYRPDELSLFSWLGVIVYLPREKVNDTLRVIAANARSGSSIVFDYMDLDAFNAEQAAGSVQANMRAVREVGEPMLTGFAPDRLEDELSVLGWALQENLNPTEINQRFFMGRSDGWQASPHSHLAWAAIK